MGVYNPSLAQTFQKPVGISKSLPTDARSYYYDENLFKWRPFQSVAEALFYLSDPVIRRGHFLVIVNEGGTLNGTTFTGGIYKAYWFKDGIGDSNLVPFHNNITVNHIGPDANGNIQIDTGGVDGTPYVLPIASSFTLGGVTVTGNNGIVIDPVTGEISSSVPLFTPQSIPFAANDGTLTEDNTGSYYDGTNAVFGQLSSGWSGVGLNGSKASVLGGPEGMLLKLAATTVDLAKSFTFSNATREYLKLFTTGTSGDASTYVNTGSLSANFLPSLDITYSLGSPDLRWLGLYAQNIVADSIIVNNLTATHIFADLIDATTINADTINTQNLFAENATITNLTATDANITNLTSEHITTNVLDATTINTDTLNSTTINNSGDINTENLNATNITTVNLTAEHIDATSITTNVLNATDINTVNLTAEHIDVTTIDAETINTTTLNSDSIVTNHITACGIDLCQFVDNISPTPYGLRNQIQFATADDSKVYYAADEVAVGTFITNDEELFAAQNVFIDFAAIYENWKRISHGHSGGGQGSLTPSNLIPGIPTETNSWSYDVTTDEVKTTINSSSFTAFVSNTTYSHYNLSATLSATQADNDFIAVVIAYAEDTSDMVANQAYGLDPDNFTWAINTTDQFIPNQHTLSMVRGRTAQTAEFGLSETIRYAIVYDLGKVGQTVIANGEVQVWNTTDNYGTGQECDVNIIRNGDVFTCTTTNWTDAPGGKGILGHPLTVDLSTNPILEKFRGASSYGYGALSQINSTFSNVSFAPNVNTIYDVRNGNIWVADSTGNYTIDSTHTYYDDFGIRRILYNPTTLKLIWVRPDKSFDILNTGSTGGGGVSADAVTDITKPDPLVNAIRVFKGTDDYFDIILDGGTTSGGGGGGATPGLQAVATVGAITTTTLTASGLFTKDATIDDVVASLESYDFIGQKGGQIILKDYSTDNFGSITPGGLTTARQYLLPDKDGTIALIEDFTSGIFRIAYTPTSSADTSGTLGMETYDDNYKYLKTSAGWKRIALSTF